MAVSLFRMKKERTTKTSSGNDEDQKNQEEGVE